MLSKSKIKYIQSLGQKKFRDAESLFIAEGPKIVDELLLSPSYIIKEILAVKNWRKVHPSLQKELQCTEISASELEKISQLTSPNQVLALIQKPQQVSFQHQRGSLTLVLETIQDPGNLGTIIRIADWFGIGLVLCSPDCADLYSPKVIQSTMGSFTRVKVYYTQLNEWIQEQNSTSIFVSVLDGEDIKTVGKISDGIICVGNESKGVSESLLELSTQKISVTRKGGAESLNAAVATGIILSHIT